MLFCQEATQPANDRLLSAVRDAAPLKQILQCVTPRVAEVLNTFFVVVKKALLNSKASTRVLSTGLQCMQVCCGRAASGQPLLLLASQQRQSPASCNQRHDGWTSWGCATRPSRRCVVRDSQQTWKPMAPWHASSPIPEAAPPLHRTPSLAAPVS